jgi:transcriptional regulator with XRE-family HTH domain
MAMNRAAQYRRGVGAASGSAGDLLRDWRQRRRLSQLDLACECEISTRHLSFVETGRAAPSREMVLRLAERLQIPLRERNTLLLAAGYAPAYPARTLDDPKLDAVRKAVEMVLAGHEPFPALSIDRHWQLLAHNRAVPLLLQGVSESLLQPPVNVLRLSLHPDGLAPRISNLLEWRDHVLERLRHQVEATADPFLLELLKELAGYPVGGGPSRRHNGESPAPVVVPFSLVTREGVLHFLSTTTVFGTPLDVTIAELAIESFFPADANTGDVMRRWIGTEKRRESRMNSASSLSF